MDISLKELIVVHLCYREVFSAPVAIADLKQWIGISHENESRFNTAVCDLEDEGHVMRKDDYLVLIGREDYIESQQLKKSYTAQLIDEGKPSVTILGKLPFIKFIGISGSLAADNPTIDKSGVNKGAVDMDLFMITSRNTLWLFVLLERIYTNLRRAIMGPHFYCFNYVTDESFLEVYNKNFYTATEIVNIKSLVDKGSFNDFVNQNLWYKNFYLKEKSGRSAESSNNSTNVWSYLFWIPNFLCFSLFCTLRATKRLDWKILKEINLSFNPRNKCNLKRISNPRGGYQEAIKQKFEHLLKENFSKYYSPELIQYLFPEDSLFGIDRLNIHDTEYAEAIMKYK
ncbi:MAG: hypothetical protein ABJF11_09160 [Reichenbachiella sp.]|uniref:hypothetical protein n=1 Tax=Reichenbachiella sp. TaxID=2184521 RepID=UPI00326597C6